MSQEILAGYKTKSKAQRARRELLAAGVPPAHIRLKAARKVGHLTSRSEAPQGALLGLVLGVLAGALAALVISLAPLGAGLALDRIAVVGAIVGGGVGAFIGALSGLSFRQTDNMDVTESVAETGWVLSIEVARPEEERIVSHLLHQSHAAFLAREPEMTGQQSPI